MNRKMIGMGGGRILLLAGLIGWGCVQETWAGAPVKDLVWSLYGVEYWHLSLSVPAERYTGTEIESWLGAAMDLTLSSSKPGYYIKESDLVAQSDEDDLVMWYKWTPSYYKVDLISTGWTLLGTPPVQNSREWMEVVGVLAPLGSGGNGPGAGGLSFTGDVVSADLDVAHGNGEEVDETVEDVQGAYFQACTNIPAKLTLRCLQYKEGIGANKRVELRKTHASADVHVYSNLALTCEVTNWPVVLTQGALYNNPHFFYVTSDTNSSTARDIEFEARSFLLDTLSYATDRVRLTAIKVDLTAYRPTTEGPAYGTPFPKTAVPEDQEEAPGAGVRVNGDDDNGNSTADRNDTTVNNENDLIEVQLKAEPYPMPSGLTYVLKRNNTRIKVWDSQTKGTAILDSGTEATITFSAATRTVWVEDPSGGNAVLDLVARSGPTDICSDKVQFYSFQAVVVGLSGEVWQDGDPLENGMYNVAQELYERGYDIHYYDEDVVDSDGAGAAYNEVVSAIQNRSVSRVVIYGHSHGGGSTHDLAERLDNNRATIGTFTTPATAYVDAIQNDSDFDMESELRLPPPATQAHLNYYQPNGLLHGGVVPGAQNLNVTTTQWGQNLDHGTIDNDANVINAVRDHVLQVQP